MSPGDIRFLIGLGAFAVLVIVGWLVRRQAALSRRSGSRVNSQATARADPREEFDRARDALSTDGTPANTFTGIAKSEQPTLGQRLESAVTLLREVCDEIGSPRYGIQHPPSIELVRRSCSIARENAEYCGVQLRQLDRCPRTDYPGGAPPLERCTLRDGHAGRHVYPSGGVSMLDADEASA